MCPPCDHHQLIVPYTNTLVCNMPCIALKHCALLRNTDSNLQPYLHQQAVALNPLAKKRRQQLYMPHQTDALTPRLEATLQYATRSRSILPTKYLIHGLFCPSFWATSNSRLWWNSSTNWWHIRGSAWENPSSVLNCFVNPFQAGNMFVWAVEGWRIMMAIKSLGCLP